MRPARGSRAPEGAVDALYAAPGPPGRFRFDAAVAAVFPDMAARSVPGYASLLHGVGVWAARHVRAGTACYDLGCARGAVARRLLRARAHAPGPVRAVDSSPDMIAACRRGPAAPGLEYACADIRTLELEPASVVVLNLTLHFLPVADRAPLLGRIARALDGGGALLLSERVRLEEPEESWALGRHEAFKRARGYSALEIARKRQALERVLIRETPAAHRARLAAAGFDEAAVWFRCLQFTSLLALRRPRA